MFLGINWNKKYISTLKILIVVLLVYFTVLVAFTSHQHRAAFFDADKIDFGEGNNKWTVIEPGKAREVANFPIALFPEKNKVIKFEKQLPMGLTDGYTFAFVGFYEDIRVKVDHKICYYETAPKTGLFSRQAATGLVVVKLPADSSGKILTVEMPATSLYNGEVSILKVYFGYDVEIYLKLLFEIRWHIIMMVIMLFIAIIDLGIHLILIHSNQKNFKMFFCYTCLFFGSIWLSGESGLLFFAIDNKLFITWFKYAALILMLQTILYYFYITYSEAQMRFCQILKYITYMGTFLFVVMFSTNILGIFSIGDFFIFVTSYGSVVVLSVMLIASQKILRHVTGIPLKINSDVNSDKGVFVLFTSNALILNYYHEYGQINQMYLYLGITIFAILLTLDALKEINEQIAITQKKELYQVLATTDMMTGLLNQNQFILDFDEAELLKSNFYVVICDINNLKYVNDNYGHDSGNIIIIETANILKEVFSDVEDVKIYRTGGDEFTIIVKSITEETLIEKRKGFYRLVDEFDKTLEYDYELASGYTIFDPAVDKNAEDTKKRADKLMYRDKEMLKFSKVGEGCDFRK